MKSLKEDNLTESSTLRKRTSHKDDLTGGILHMKTNSQEGALIGI